MQSKRDFVERVLSQISSVITYFRRNLTDNNIMIIVAIFDLYSSGRLRKEI